MSAASETDRKPDSVTSEGVSIPGPRGLALVRRLLAMRASPLDMLQQTVVDYGDAVWLPMGRFDLVLLNHPDHVAHVLQAGAQRYGKSASYRELELVLGKGLLTSEGAFWKKQRRTVQPSFRKRQIAGFAPTIVAETERMLADWTAREDVDLGQEMVRLTLGVVGRVFFSTDLGAEADRLGQAMNACLPVVQQRTEAVVNLPMWLPLPSHLRLRRHLRVLDELVAGLIAEREAQGEEAAPPDLLSRLVFARDPETGERMPPAQVRDEIVTFLLAGHETTAHALTWTFVLLARHPGVLAAVREEAERVLGDRAPTAEDAPKLELTRRVLLEAMRLYPPAWIVEREALVDDVVGGFRVPKGSLVMLCSYTVHRHAEFWEDPERFDPDRFLPERAAARHRCAYFPFGAGQRQCVGEGFAMLEMLLVVPLIARAFGVALRDPEAIAPHAGITLRPAAPIRARLLPAKG